MRRVRERMSKQGKSPVAWSGRVKAAMRLRKVSGSDEGTSLVEMALATSVVLMLMFGVFDFSLAFYTYHYVSDAAREGARYAMVRGSTACTNTPNLDICKAGDTTGATQADIAAYIASLNYPAIDTSKITVNVSTCPATTQSNGVTSWPSGTSCTSGTGDNQPDNLVQVQVVYTFPLSVPFWTQTGLAIKSTSAMSITQ